MIIRVSHISYEFLIYVSIYIMTNLNLIPSWTLRLVYLLTRDVQPVRNVSAHRPADRLPMPLWARAHRSDGTVERVLCVAQLHVGTSTRSGHGILRLGARQGHREIRVHIDAWGVEPAHEKGHNARGGAAMDPGSRGNHRSGRSETVLRVIHRCPEAGATHTGR
jgi:hypothetical protein